jgi:hypothetical protein
MSVKRQVSRQDPRTSDLGTQASNAPKNWRWSNRKNTGTQVSFEILMLGKTEVKSFALAAILTATCLAISKYKALN